MRAMQDLRPEMERIRAQYRDNRQKQQEEIMRLYQERKVNPLGGCLPILVQMPIFIGIFYVIRKFGGQPGYSEPLYPSFREGGILWFQDLSHMDPYFVLPVLSALTLLAATEITAKNVDPQQRWLMRLLPIGITVFLWSFPAGLFVYWITSNLVTLAQNYVIYHHGPGKRPPGSEPGGIFSRPGGTGNGGNGARAPDSRRQRDGESGQASADDASAQAAKTAKRKRRKKKKK
jgi:YidC/Oxa1 family membrane protein insertase